MNILLLIPSLHIGGTERQVVALAVGLQKKAHTILVATLYPGGELESDLMDVSLLRVGKKGRWDIFGSLSRLKALIHEHDIDVVYTFLGTPNIMGAVLKPFIRVKLVWGIRASEMRLSNYGWLSWVAHHLESFLAHAPHLIIANSRAGKSHAAASGFPEASMQVVHNGIDTDTFRPDARSRSAMRFAWGVTDAQCLIGLPARIDPIKGHEVFLEAARIVAAKAPDARFVCVGGGDKSRTESLKQLSRTLGIQDVVIWARQQKCMPEVYNALDMVCLSSYGEGFPNAIAEAMACGIPCAATEAGDSAFIIGETGATAPVENPEALARAILSVKARSENGPELGQLCRQRIVENFGLDIMVDKTLIQLESIVGRRPASHAENGQ